MIKMGKNLSIADPLSVPYQWVLLLFVYLHAVFERESRPCARHVALYTATGGALCVIAAVMVFLA